MEEIDFIDLSNNIKIDKRTLRNRGNRTEKQLEAWEKVVQIRAEKRLERKAQKEQAEAEAQKELEDRILKKALSIKKRQIKALHEIDKIQDDETPIEDIRQIIAQQQRQIYPDGQHKKEIPIKKIFSFI
jgi:hypothetical protein